MNNKIINLQSSLHPVNAVLAFTLNTNQAESFLEVARATSDPSLDWVRILTNASDTSIIDEAIYDLFTTPGWAELLPDPQ